LKGSPSWVLSRALRDGVTQRYFNKSECLKSSQEK